MKHCSPMLFYFLKLIFSLQKGDQRVQLKKIIEEASLKLIPCRSLKLLKQKRMVSLFNSVTYAPDLQRKRTKGQKEKKNEGEREKREREREKERSMKMERIRERLCCIIGFFISHYYNAIDLFIKHLPLQILIYHFLLLVIRLSTP